MSTGASEAFGYCAAMFAVPLLAWLLLKVVGAFNDR